MKYKVDDQIALMGNWEIKIGTIYVVRQTINSYLIRWGNRGTMSSETEYSLELSGAIKLCRPK